MSKYADCGFVYIATGKKYIEEALYSSKTLRQHHPDIPICLFTDDNKYFESIPHSFDQIFEVKDAYYSFLDKLQMINSPYERSIFIDTDTICVEPVHELFDLLNSCELIVNQNGEGFDYDYKSYGLTDAQAEFNTGVLGFVKSKMLAHRFFERWRELYLRYDHLRLTDQFSFRLLLYNSEVRYSWITSAYNFFIYFPNYISTKAKIIHGRPFERLHQISIKMNDTRNLVRSWHRTYYPEINAVVYDKLSFWDNWKFIRLLSVLQVKILYRSLRHGKR